MTPSEYCRIVENRLGWVPPSGPEWKRYIAEAGKVTRKIRTNPELYTWKNLLLAVELLVREKEPRTPVGVFAHVERAVGMAREDDSDIETKIREALKFETRRGDPHGWVVRFARAHGAWRTEAYREWEYERGLT